jgi:16S rRNA (uracil1498-N3)-methyltransferase
MPRFFLPAEKSRGQTLVLEDQEAHHAIHVLRIKPGEAADVLDGCGGINNCKIVDIGRDTVTLQVLQHRQQPPAPCRVTLAQCLPKTKAMDWLLQKATELGASRIVPLFSDHSEIHLDAPSAQAKARKWNAASIETLKQCGTPWLPVVECPLQLDDFLKRGTGSELNLVASLQKDAPTLIETLRGAHANNRPFPPSVCVWIGPEGDFSPRELALLLQAGTLPVSLGERVLRAETAALYCLSAIHYESQAATARW